MLDFVCLKWSDFRNLLHLVKVLQEIMCCIEYLLWVLGSIHDLFWMFSLRIIWSLKFIKSRSQWFEIIRNQINLSCLCNFNWRSYKSILSIFISMMRYWGDCLWKLCYVVLMSSLFQRRIFDLNQDVFWRLNVLLSRLNSLWVCVFKNLNWRR